MRAIRYGRILLILVLSFCWMSSTVFAGDWMTSDDGIRVWVDIPVQPGYTVKWVGGQTQSGIAHGKGVLTVYWRGNISETLEVEMVDGKAQGQGISTTPHWTYIGEYRDGRKHGKGVLTTTIRSLYTGEPVGQKVYEGDFANGIPNGRGTIKDYKGDVYEGQITHYEPNGKGIIKFVNGIIYEGDFIKGVRTGKAVIKWPNGVSYEGDVLSGNRHGFGKTTFPNGDVHEGEYRDDNFNGQGIFKWSDGRVYEGIFIKGVFHGHGSLRNQDGSIIKNGEWRDGRFIDE